MSLTLILSGKSSELRSRFYPPLELEGQWSIGLVDFQTYNSIANIDKDNCMFRYLDTRLKEISIPTGVYDLEDIRNYIKKSLPSHVIFELVGNSNTLKAEIYCNKKIDFSQPGTIGPMLGFEPRVYEAGKRHESQYPVNIQAVNAICISCNMATGSYYNGIPSNIIYEFSSMVSPGFKLVEAPQSIIYSPVSTRDVHEVVVTIVDQRGQLVNFRNEEITLRLHLKKDGSDV